MERFDDRVALVTGGASGIGAAVVRRLDAAGARVAVLDVDEDRASALAAHLRDGVALPVDVGDSAQVDAAVDAVVQRWGRVDVLVNNAGIRGGAERDAATDRLEHRLTEGGDAPLNATVGISDDAWRRMMATHLDGTFHCMRAGLRVMTPQRFGAIVNVASICGIEGCPNTPHYSAAKAGILGLTRAVAREVAPLGIRVNAVAPGYVDTPMLAVLTPAMRAALTARTPLGRLGAAEDIAAAIVFLASDAAAFVVGETLSPNGGMLTV